MTNPDSNQNQLIVKLEDGWIVRSNEPVIYIPNAPPGITTAGPFGMIFATPSSTGANYVGMPLPSQDATLAGPNLLIICPHNETEFEFGAQKAKRIADQLAGLVAVMVGPYLVQFQIFENVYDPARGTRSVIGSMPPVSVGGKSLMNSEITNADSCFNKMGDGLFGARLSLHWHMRGLAEEGLDSFLYHWIAIETLVGSDQSNIAVHKKIIAAALDLPLDRLEEVIPLGRLLGLRSKIIHNGFTPQLDFPFNQWVAHIYCDMLRECLGLGRLRQSLENAAEGRTTLAKLNR
jgi:hypothetical protein